MLYPNPARAEVRLTVEHLPAVTAVADVLDGVGRVVRTATVREGTTLVSLAGLAPGLYAVRVAGRHYQLAVE